MRSVQAITLGCSKNRVDTEHILSSLEGHFEIVSEGEEKDYVDYLLINTCGLLIRIGSVFFVIPQFGIQGYLWGLLVSQLTVSVLAFTALLTQASKE